MGLFISNFASQLLLLEIRFTLPLVLVGHFWFCLCRYFFFNRHFARVLTIETTFFFLEEISCQLDST